MKRGAVRPVFAAAMVSIAACAMATTMKVDLATPVDAARYRAQLQAMERCEAGALDIAYAFGEVALTLESKGVACFLKVAIAGELGEDAAPQQYRCSIDAIQRIDWLQSPSGQRDRPPLEELRAEPSCSRVR